MVRNSKFSFEHVEFEMPVEHLSGNIQLETSFWSRGDRCELDVWFWME